MLASAGLVGTGTNPARMQIVPRLECGGLVDGLLVTAREPADAGELTSTDFRYTQRSLGIGCPQAGMGVPARPA
jgi:hypothetical protein